MNKGTQPKTARELKDELQSLWSLTSNWRLMPMGKGYFTLKFNNKEDKAIDKSHLAWELSSGTLRLREWVRFFNPYKESSSLAQVWVRIYYLPVEFWHPEVLSGIGRWLGQPLKIDGNSVDDDVAHYARMLVEVDLANMLPEYMTIDGGDYEFDIEFYYEYIPPFCTKCKMTGHVVDKCRRGKTKGKETVEPVKQNEPNWQEVRTKERRREGVNEAFEPSIGEHPNNELSGPDLLEALTRSAAKSQSATRFAILEEGEVSENAEQHETAAEQERRDVGQEHFQQEVVEFDQRLTPLPNKSRDEQSEHQRVQVGAVGNAEIEGQSLDQSREFLEWDQRPDNTELNVHNEDITGLQELGVNSKENVEQSRATE
ncbi:uncharacterized protein LOC131003176 [Salvia miltiorrhiza]|uniref:uncharacterized protein LOC131003176 n=1 Tax=Salvia miltiorrhiza TaxID=226208 RepID=UPI0025AC45C5|nr:uncharacterized protein LOC131003176 [Salvia miltiorrhiza]